MTGRSPLGWPHLPDDHFLHRYGFREVAVEGADAAVDLDIRSDLSNGRDGLHGGMIATLVDVTAAKAVQVHARDTTMISTQDLSVHYLEGLRAGPARAVGRVRRVGSHAVVVQIEVFDHDDDDRLCAIATVTYRVRRPPPA